MRSAPLTTIQGGINRLRTKGGARADTLYDLVNGYRLESGEVQGRPGTKRHALLDAATKGLVSFDGALHTFCHKAVYVPDGYVLNVLVRPDKTVAIAGNPFAFSVTCGHITGGGGLADYVGADPGGMIGGGAFGSFVDATAPSGVQVVGLYGYSYAGTSTYPQQQTLVMLLTDGGAPAASNAFDAITFVDALGVQRIFARADAADPNGYASGTVREWSWAIGPVAKVMAAGETYTVSMTGVGDTPTVDVTTQGEQFPIKRIRFAEPFMGALYVAAEFSDGAIFHYWLQAGEQWEANKVYKAGDIVYPSAPTGFVYKATRLGSANPAWAPSVLRYDGSGPEAQSVVEPTTYNDFYYKCTSTTGASPRSGTEEPPWPTEPGATVVESTDNPPDVNIPTTTSPVNTSVPSNVTYRYGDFLSGTVTR